MSVSIRQIHIENFRSIQKMTIPTGYLSVFVGKNDCGKSNILRALNLFFNGVTNPGKPFVFEDDYNLFVTERAKVAKEITVRVELNIPSTYWTTNGQVIVWQKRWRQGGLHSENYWGLRLSRSRRGSELQEVVEIPDRSNAHSLLRHIEFEYVPAIKDANYFDGLRGRIYNIIAEVATRTFRTSSTAFEDSIGDHLRDLTNEIDGVLGIQTRLALPRDLSHIFERLDFLSGEKSISLDHRGDGIKVRHIPLILEFMARKKRSLQVRGAMPYSFIWAYEEPENNLEFASAVQLADQLSKFAQEHIAQILLTTHSPVFYDLTSEDGNACCSHVFRDKDETGTQASDSASDVDEKMGTMALLAPRVKNAVQQVRDQIEARMVTERLAEENRCKIFVEGESDKIVLQRCMKIFFPSEERRIDIETKPRGGGVNYVMDMLMGWRAQHKHHPSKPRAAGIVDWDAIPEKKKWNETPGNVSSAKCFCYPKPPHAITALKAGFRLIVTLEVLYSAEMWQWAQENDFLEARPLIDVLPHQTVESILNEETSVKDAIDESFAIYVTHRFNAESKIAAARYVASLDARRLRREFAPIQTLLKDILDYFGIGMPDNQDHPES